MKAIALENALMIQALLAESRSFDVPEEDDIYGWLIGGWELEVTGWDDEGTVTHSAGEAHFSWVLEGRAVQDVFINPRRPDRTSASPRFANWYGTTIGCTIRPAEPGGSTGSIRMTASVQN